LRRSGARQGDLNPGWRRRGGDGSLVDGGRSGRCLVTSATNRHRGDLRWGRSAGGSCSRRCSGEGRGRGRGNRAGTVGFRSSRDGWRAGCRGRSGTSEWSGWETGGATSSRRDIGIGVARDAGIPT
jgi:hypothetical protein